MKRTPANELTQNILEHLYSIGVFAWREDSTPVPLVRAGVFAGFRPPRKTGKSDIMAVLPPLGRLLCCEVKIGRDRLRPEQVGFLATVDKMGGFTMVVKDFQDYLGKIEKILLEISQKK